jgi:hypothetical protein
VRRRARRVDAASSQSRKRQPSLVIPQASRTPVVQHRPQPPQEAEQTLAFPPDPPDTKRVALFPSLLEQCHSFYDYPILRVPPSSFPPHPPDQTIEKKTAAWGSLFNLVDDPVLSSLLPVTAFTDLFSLVEGHLFRPIPAFSPPNAFSEVSEIWVVKNWVHVLAAHRILQILLLDYERFSQLIRPEFTAQLVQQLDTPVPEEQQEIETDLHLLLQKYYGFRRPILRCMLSKLVAYLDGVTYITWSVGPVLRLFLTYFGTLPGPVKQSNFLLFRNVFYPLFATEFGYLFENSLTDLAAFFQSRDRATAFWSLKYLKNHWPKTSTRKQLVMFRQLTVLIPMLPMTLFDKVGPIILRTLAPCLTSEHFQVALNSAMFCSSAEFLHLFRTIPDEVSNILIGPARESTTHWSPEQQEMAQYLVDTLQDFEFASKPAIRARTARSPRRKVMVGWGDVVEIAADSDASVDRECEREKLRQWLVYANSSTSTA